MVDEVSITMYSEANERGWDDSRLKETTTCHCDLCAIFVQTNCNNDVYFNSCHSKWDTFYRVEMNSTVWIILLHLYMKAILSIKPTNKNVLVIWLYRTSRIWQRITCIPKQNYVLLKVWKQKFTNNCNGVATRSFVYNYAHSQPNKENQFSYSLQPKAFRNMHGTFW